MKMTDEKATHAVAPEEVMAYLDGELRAEEAVGVAAHVRECPECAAMAEEFGGISRSLRAWTVDAAPERLEREIRRAVGENAAGTRRRVGRKVWVWSGVAAGIVVVVGLLMVPTMGNYRHAASPSMMAPLDSSMTQSQNQQLVAGDVNGYAYDGRNMAALTKIAPGVASTAASAMQGKADRYRGGVENLGGGGAPAYSPQAPMIARTMTLTVLVKSFDAANAQLTRILTVHRGYAADLTIADLDPPRGLYGDLRIPVTELDATVAQIRALGRVEKESQKGEEVTAQHADLVARLTNSREEEARLRALLAQRTGKIEDMLQVEEEIARVRGEIEQMEAEQKGLEHRVDFASVELKLVEEYAARLGPPAEDTGTRVHNAFVAGVQNAGSSLLGLVLFVEEYGPVMLIWGVILGVPAWLVWRRYGKARASLR